MEIESQTIQFFLNGVCRHELLVKENALIIVFLNGVCRHEQAS